VRSRTTKKFRDLFDSLPRATQDKAKAAYALWSANPDHRSLRFKKVHSTLPVYSVRIDLDWRAVGILNGEAVVWFWIGSHADYERLLRSL
jgi:hypothetical protein